MNARDSLLLLAAAVCVAGGLVHFHASQKPAAPPVAATFLPACGVSQTGISPHRVAVVPADQPVDPAITQSRQLFAADPDDREGRAFALLADLCRDGNFPIALQLAGEAPADLRDGWLKFVFTRWGGTHPAAAMQAVDTLTDPDQHTAAFQAAVSGWNSRDPAGLADYAHALAPGADHDFALGTALNNWSLQDPAALGTWLNNLPPGSEFDQGAALMLTHTDGANRSPEVAAKWVEAIGDVGLKEKSLANLLNEWSQTDAAAARQYLANAAWVDDSLRGKMLDTLARASAAE